jgi:chromosome segregation ATPase
MPELVWILVAAVAGFAVAWVWRAAAVRKLRNLITAKDEALVRIDNAEGEELRIARAEAEQLRVKVAELEAATAGDTGNAEALAERDQEITRLRRSVMEVQESLRRVIVEKEGVVAELRVRLDELEPLRRKVKQLEDAAAGAGAATASQVREVEELRTLLSQKDAEAARAIEQKDVELASAQAEIEALRSSARLIEQQGDEQRAALLQKLEQREAAYKSLEARAVHFEDEVREALVQKENEIEALREQVESLAELDEEDADHQAEISGWESRVSGLEQLAASKDEELAALRVLLAEHSRAAEKLEELAKTLEERDASIVQLENWIQQLSVRVEEEQARATQLGSDRDVADAAARAASDRLRQMETERQDLEFQLGDLAEAKDAESRYLRAALESAQAKLAEAERAPATNGFNTPGLQFAEQQIRELHKQMQSYEEALRDRDQTIARLRSEREPNPRLY